MIDLSVKRVTIGIPLNDLDTVDILHIDGLALASVAEIHRVLSLRTHNSGSRILLRRVLQASDRMVTLRSSVAFVTTIA